MNIQIPIETLSDYKSKDLIPLKCLFCTCIFYRPKGLLQAALHSKESITPYRNPETEFNYCSKKCSSSAQTTKITFNCTLCGNESTRTPSQVTKVTNLFCSKSCAATYNNKHKTSGTRRSKLEIYLETQVKARYPDLPCLFNSKETIGSELDFYFPTLKLAVELNGIFHYEPIYGEDKLERIQDNDSQKAIHCYKQGIEFCSIDSSTCNHLTQAAKDKYWTILSNVLEQVIQRNNTGGRDRI